MTNSRKGQLTWAALLFGGGLLLLLFNLGVLASFEPLAQWLAAGVLVLGAVAMFISYGAGREAWWRLIPAWTLLSLAAAILVVTYWSQGGDIAAALLLWGLAIAFAHIYLAARTERWWAILPGGFLAVFGAVFLLSTRVESFQVLGAFLFAGAGLVFVLVSLSGGGGPRHWAMIPAAILLLFGFFVLSLAGSGQGSLLRWWPLALVVAGVIMAWWALRSRQAPRQIEVNRAPGVRRTEMVPATPAAIAKSRPAPGDQTAAAPGATVEVFPESEE